MRRFERPVYNLIVRMVRNEATAEDLTQDTFLKMFRALPTYKQETCGCRAGCCASPTTPPSTISDNAGCSRSGPPRTMKARSAIRWTRCPTSTLISPEQSSLRRELASAVDLALDRLRPDFRAVVVLRYQEGLDYLEIAQVLGVPLGTVKTFLHRARRQLARELGAAGWGPETTPGTRP